MEGVQLLTYALTVFSIGKQIILEVFTLQIAGNSLLSQTWLICSSHIRVGFGEKHCKWKKHLGVGKVCLWVVQVDRVQLHTTLSWSNFGFQERRVKKEASTLGEEEDSVEALVKRRRTYPKHQPHVYEPEKASWHLTTKASLMSLESQSVGVPWPWAQGLCGSDSVWTWLVPLFTCWKKWGTLCPVLI